MTALVVFIEHRLLKAVFFQRHTDTHRAMAYTAPEQRRVEKNCTPSDSPVIFWNVTQAFIKIPSAADRNAMISPVYKI